MEIQKLTERADEYKYMGNFAACEPWAAVYMECHDCRVSWNGCWDNFECPVCRRGDLPNQNEPPYASTLRPEGT